jgi:hypothetical protein
MPTTLPNNSAIQTGGRFDADIALSLRIPSRSRYLDLLETELPMIWLILLAVLAAGFLGGAIGGQIAESNYPPKNCREEINRFFSKTAIATQFLRQGWGTSHSVACPLCSFGVYTDL